MAIEIKQLLIKSNVVDDDKDSELDEAALVAMKHDVLNECRRLIKEMLNDKGQR